MTTGKFASLLAVAVAMSAGQLLFKMAAQRSPGEWRADTTTLWSLVTNTYLIAALLLYSVTTVVWVYVLRDASLSQSYPFMAIAMVMVPLAAVALFGEPLTTSLILGTGLVVAGILVVASGL